MDIVCIAITIFRVMETHNICIPYLYPDGHIGNGVGVFKVYEQSKSHHEVRALTNYLAKCITLSDRVGLRARLLPSHGGSHRRRADCSGRSVSRPPRRRVNR